MPALNEPVVVTGAGGFVGTRLLAALRRLDVDAVAWTRELGDLRDAQAVHRGLKALRPQTVFHLAANPSTAVEPAASWIAGEVAMVRNLHASMSPGSRLICTGTMAEYGDSGTFHEVSPRRPTSTYGIAKAAASDQAVACANVRGVEVRLARLFGVYGPGENPGRLIPSVVQSLVRAQPVALSDGMQIRDFVHVDDVCAVLIRLGLLDGPVPTVLNVGTGTGVSVRRVCESVCALVGADRALLNFGALPRRAVDEDLLVADTKALAEIILVPPQHWLDTRSGLAREFVVNLAAQAG